MSRVEFNKLIRDRIKDKIEKSGDTCEVVTLEDDERFREALLLKVVEGAEELRQTKNREDFLSEYADLMAVLDELCSLYALSDADIKLSLVENMEKKGGFKSRHFLCWSESK